MVSRRAMSERAWRLLVTEPTDGATNMAIDEAVWRGRQAGTSPPTLRFFAWAPPTGSLGYGQPLGRDVDVEACRALGVGLVRRPTGGSAIYHDGRERELTYSVMATAELVPERPPAGPVPAFCFARTGVFEIEAGGRKLVGSAQRRQGDSFLQ